MKSFCKAMEGLDWIVKLVLAIPVLDIIWNIYRLCKSITKGNILGIVLAIILILPGAMFMWLVDIISIIVFKKVLWID